MESRKAALEEALSGVKEQLMDYVPKLIVDGLLDQMRASFHEYSHVIIKSDQVKRQLDVTGSEHIEVHISEDGKVLWVNNEFTCLLRVCRIKNLILQDDRGAT